MRREEIVVAPLSITVIDLVAKGATTKKFGKLMKPNLASIMPQVVAVWCEQLGHRVNYICYTGVEDLSTQLIDDTDLVFIAAFTRSAQLAYAISHLFRGRGVPTALGGPHARCYPEDSAKYFDYVLGFTDKNLVDEVVREREPQRPLGKVLSSAAQPPYLPGAKERWKFIKAAIDKTPFLKLIPMLGSTGCPYTCSFCIDSTVDYRPLGPEAIKEDLRFLLTQMRRPNVAWHDPLFGVRFKESMAMIEEAIPRDSINFYAEISLSLLSEPHVKKLAEVGFKAILPGIESWYEFGNKSKTRRATGEDKVRQVSEHINMMLRYIPFVQANLVLGLDCDEGPEPFELTKQFIREVPGAWPAFSLITSYGRAAPLNLEFQRAGRLIPLPFHFLDNHHINVRPENYGWAELYEYTAGLTEAAFSWAQIGRRFKAAPGIKSRFFNTARAISSGRPRKHGKMGEMMTSDASFRRFFDGESTVVPDYFVDIVRRDLGPMWQHLPAGALDHDANAYLKATEAREKAGEKFSTLPVGAPVILAT